MKKVSLNSTKQVTGLTTLSSDELKNISGGGKVVFIQTIKDGKIIWELAIR